MDDLAEEPQGLGVTRPRLEGAVDAALGLVREVVGAVVVAAEERALGDLGVLHPQQQEVHARVREFGERLAFHLARVGAAALGGQLQGV